VAYDPEGQLLTASYQDYCVPRADDIPPIAVTLDDSAPCRTNPLGAKGCQGLSRVAVNPARSAGHPASPMA
jgi:CO/xanthine dehydrogenase Mo-binding subunit